VKFGHRPICLFALAFLLTACVAIPPRASSQALYTATQQLSISAWGGATGTEVKLPTGGRNLGITAGVDLRVWQFHGLLPSIEIRGTYPFDKGSIAGEENALAGIKVEHIFGRYHLYGDFLFGRSSIKYQGRGYISPNDLYLYQQSYTNVLSPGGGVDVDLTHHYAFKADAQLWHQSVPVTASGKLNSLAVTLGAIYRFDFNHAPRALRTSRSQPAGTSPPVSTAP
jgi:hypothetical protein